jgi:hypothetical protein
MSMDRGRSFDGGNNLDNQDNSKNYGKVAEHYTVVSSQNLKQFSNSEIDSCYEGGAGAGAGADAGGNNRDRDEMMVQPNLNALANNESQNQIHPILSLVLLVLAMIILAVVTFYTKLMIQFEGQNQMEAFYAINGFTLLIVAGIIIVKIKGQAK